MVDEAMMNFIKQSIENVGADIEINQAAKESPRLKRAMTFAAGLEQ